MASGSSMSYGWEYDIVDMLDVELGYGAGRL